MSLSHSDEITLAKEFNNNIKILNAGLTRTIRTIKKAREECQLTIKLLGEVNDERKKHP
jgi:hypothetical protein